MSTCCRPRIREPVLLSALLSLGSTALSNCGRAVPEEDTKGDITEVAVQVGTVMKADLRTRIEAYGRAGTCEGRGFKRWRQARGANRWNCCSSAVEGQTVKAGDMVVNLDDRVAQAAVDKAHHTLVFAQQVADRLGARPGYCGEQN